MFMLQLMQFLRGYVRIVVTGNNIERFLNMATFRGIFLWDIEHMPNGVSMNASIKGFRILRVCAKKTQCRTKIIEKNGLPFILFRYRRRKLLMGGVVFFVVGLFILSSFVWRIDIEGNETLTYDVILEFLEEQGLSIGSLKFRFSDRELQRALSSHFTEISWADVHTRGTRTTVLITEVIPQQEILDRRTPAHVVASADGLITGIVTGSGAPMVRQNDIVRRGELLVSGVLELDPTNPSGQLVYVQAYAEVWARRYQVIEFVVPLTYTEKIFTGNMATSYAFQLLFAGNRRITLPRGRITFDNYDRITTHHQPGVSGNYPLPFVLVADRYAEFTPITRTRTIEEAKLLAEQMVTGRILREFDFAIDIIDRQVNFEESETELLVNALITTHERIDLQIPIIAP